MKFFKFLENIQSCLNEITRGESYELCLTNKVLVNYQPDPYKFFSQLRKNNPAPYSAFLQFDDFSIVSCSPEKFLTISRKREIEYQRYYWKRKNKKKINS